MIRAWPHIPRTSAPRRQADLAEAVQGVAGRLEVFGRKWKHGRVDFDFSRYANAVRRIEHLFMQYVRPPLVTVSLSPDSAQVVVFKGQEPISWGRARLETQAEGATPSGILRALVKELGVDHGRVVVDLPIYSLLFRDIALPPMARKFREQVIFSEVLQSIPFDHDLVDVSWQSQRSSTGEQVCAVAMHKGEIDRLMNVLTGAGLRPRAAYSRAMSLTRLSGITDGILVYLEEGSVSAVLIRDRTPTMVHQVPQAVEGAGQLDPGKLTERIAVQAASYYRTLVPEGGEAEVPISVAGWTAGIDSESDLLNGLAGAHIVGLDPQHNFPTSFQRKHIRQMWPWRRRQSRLGTGGSKGLPLRLRHRIYFLPDICREPSPSRPRES